MKAGQFTALIYFFLIFLELMLNLYTLIYNEYSYKIQRLLEYFQKVCENVYCNIFYQ